ncbi:MAG: hypothetical protein AAFQ79_12055 [Pseudomonadota bacterium]
MNEGPQNDTALSDAEISVKALLVALAVECRVAACDLDRIQQIFENLRRATPANLTSDQIVLIQEIDRLTQTVAAIGRSVEAAHDALPDLALDQVNLRQAAGLDSLFHRVVTGNSGSISARHRDVDGHTTIF